MFTCHVLQWVLRQKRAKRVLYQRLPNQRTMATLEKKFTDVSHRIRGLIPLA